MRILLAEDEVILREPLIELLEAHNFILDAVSNGEDAIAYALEGKYDVIILDIMMPIKDGYAVVKTLRDRNDETPIILLTALGETEHIVKGLDAGADDYLTKPFAIEELVARVTALNRRKEKAIKIDRIADSDTVFDVEKATLMHGDKEVILSLKEFELYRELQSISPALIDKDTLVQKLWRFDEYAGPNNVEVHVSSLRKKMQQIESDLQIETQRGFGYRLRKIEKE